MKKFQFLSLIAFVSVFVISCSNENDTHTGKTPVTLKITDAPAFYDAIYLNIDEIEIRTTTGKEDIDVDGLPFDILQYRFGKDTVIAAEDVPSGTIQEIRLKLHNEGNQVVIDGISYPLTTPSGQSSGIKIKVQEELIPNVAYTLLLDFDAAKSIHQTGNGKYMLKPVIRAVPVVVSGTIRGTIIPAESLSHIYAIDGLDTIGTQANSVGDFYIPGVPQGNYKILIEPSAGDYNPKVIENVEVTKGSVQNLGIIDLQ